MKLYRYHNSIVIAFDTDLAVNTNITEITSDMLESADKLMGKLTYEDMDNRGKKNKATQAIREFERKFELHTTYAHKSYYLKNGAGFVRNVECQQWTHPNEINLMELL